jgi:hypothetical protein
MASLRRIAAEMAGEVSEGVLAGFAREIRPRLLAGLDRTLTGAKLMFVSSDRTSAAHCRVTLVTGRPQCGLDAGTA